MDLKTVIVLETHKENRTYTLTMPAGASLGECYDVVHEFLRKVLELAHQSAETIKPLGEDHA